MSSTDATNTTNRIGRLLASLRPYVEAAPVAAFFIGVSSAFPFALIGATLTTRLAQDGITKSTVTAFAFLFLAYNFKFLWAPLIDNLRLPIIGRFGQRRSWLWLISLLLVVAVIGLGVADPTQSLAAVAVAALAVGVLGATLDIVLDAYRIELLKPHQLGTGAGMHQYGWRVGAAVTGGLALQLASSFDWTVPYAISIPGLSLAGTLTGWTVAYTLCAVFILPAIGVSVIMGEPARAAKPVAHQNMVRTLIDYFSPLAEFIRRQGAWVVLCFVLIHKIGDTLANLTLRLLFNDMGYTNEEIAFYDVYFGFLATLAGIFVGGILYAGMGLKRAVLLSLILMAVSNFSFAALALAGHSNLGMAAAIGFENFASGIGGITVVAYLSALCNLRFTATQYALLSALASIAGRIISGTTAGNLIETLGYVNFYLLTTILAFPGVLLFWYMIRSGLADVSLGDAGKEPEPNPPQRASN